MMKSPGWMRFKNAMNAGLTFVLAMAAWSALFALMAAWSQDDQIWLIGVFYLIVAAVTAWHAVRQFRWHNYVDDVGPEAPPD